MTVNPARAGFGKFETAAAKSGCDIDLFENAVYFLVSIAVLYVATHALPYVPKLHAVHAKVESAEDTMREEPFHDATVTRVKKGYDITLHNGQELHCGARPDPDKTYPVSLASGRVECQRHVWNTCRVRATYKGRKYDLDQPRAGKCAPLVGTEQTYYTDKKAHKLEATNWHAWARLGLHAVQVATVYGAITHGLRAYMLPSVCAFDMHEELKRVGGARCKAFADAYMQELRLAKSGVAYNAVQSAGEIVGGVGGDVVAGAAKLASMQNRVREELRGMQADLELWRCVNNVAPGEGMGRYIGITAGAAVLAFVVAFGVGRGAATMALPHPSGVPPGVIPMGAGVLVGMVGAKTTLLVLRGLRRQSLGLTFLDIPNLVI